MRLKGKHAQKVETIEDALGKLGAGRMTQKEYEAMAALVSKGQGGLGTVTTAHGPQKPLKIPGIS